jgi:hypothetical protein
MHAEPGLELVCHARNYRFAQQGIPRQRGVISYYAVQALPQATTLSAWLQEIERLVQRDVRQSRLPEFYQPSLHILGEATALLPGQAVPSELGPRP